MSVSAQAGISVEAFVAQRQRVVEALATIRRVAEQVGASSTADEAARTAASLEDDAFRICVMGAFSRGKSTVINAMLGDRVLPSSSQPTTAILSLISYAERPSFLLKFYGKKRDREVSRDEFRTLVAPPEPTPGDKAEGQGYRKRLAELAGIRQAEVGFPFPLCRDAVLVVDTPGTNDLDPRREQITYEFIPQSDAVVLVLSAKMPLSEDEVALLQDRVFPSDIQRIFFLVNFADALETEADRQKVTRHIERGLRKIIRGPRLHLVSARAALRARQRRVPEETLATTGIPEFETDLTRFLLEERAAVKLAKPVARGLTLCSELRTGPLPLMEATAKMTLEELRGKVRFLSAGIRGLRAERDSAIASLRSAFERASLDLGDRLRRELESIATAAADTVRTYHGPMTPENLSRAIERVVAPRQTALQRDLRQRQKDIAVKEIDRAQRRLSRPWKVLRRSLDRAFGTSLSYTVNNRFDVSSAMGLQIDDSDGKALAAGTVAGLAAATVLSVPLLPAALIALAVGAFTKEATAERQSSDPRAQLRARVDQRYREPIPRAVSQFRHKWHEVTGSLADSLTREFERSLGDLTGKMESLLEERGTLAHDIDAVHAQVAEMRLELDEAGSLLADVREEAQLQ